LRFSVFILSIFSLFCVQHSAVHAQKNAKKELEQLNAELDAIFADEDDSLSLIFLIDQMLSVQQIYSEVQFRMGYSSRVTSAGRDFGIDQQGITPGISFYHWSGLFADATGFWNSELDPQYNLSVFTLGYISQIGKHSSYSMTYDHSFFAEKDSLNTLTNSLNASITRDFKYIYTGLDYSFSFGNETAHRLIWNVTGNINFKGFGPIKKVTLLPSVAFLMGNQNIITQFYDINRFEQIQHLTLRQVHQITASGKYTEEEIRQLTAIRRLARQDQLRPQQEAFLNEFFTSTEESATFSWMNTYLTLPVIFYTKRLSFYLSYNFNIPRDIANSEFVYESNGYFGFGVAYNLKVYKRK